ncbi:MAG: diversity-generating retroelement protein Avd [Wenzhouxiangella sp.]
MSRGANLQPRPPAGGDLIIRKKVEDMTRYAYVALRQFPKSERHVLSAEIRGACWRLLRLVIICNKRYHKKTTLQDLDAELDLLRCQVRIAFELQYLPPRKYEHWSRLNDEIGRLVGGWLRAQEPRPARAVG